MRDSHGSRTALTWNPSRSFATLTAKRGRRRRRWKNCSMCCRRAGCSPGCSRSRSCDRSPTNSTAGLHAIVIDLAAETIAPCALPTSIMGMHQPRSESLVKARQAALILLALSCAPPPSPQPSRGGNADWRTTGGDAGNSRYSYLDQINRSNVANLQVAWVYHTGDSSSRSQIQATPIVIDGVLYTSTPALAVVALRADSGTPIWRFDPFANRTRATHVNRGVAFWSDGIQKRVFFTAGRQLYSIDASNGRLDLAFGDSGSVDLGAGPSRDAGDA